MLREIISRASLAGYSAKFDKSSTHWQCALLDEDNNELYSYTTTEYYDMILRVMEVVNKIAIAPENLKEEITNIPL